MISKYFDCDLSNFEEIIVMKSLISLEVVIIRRIDAKNKPNIKEQRIKLKFERFVYYDAINYQKKSLRPRISIP